MASALLEKFPELLPPDAFGVPSRRRFLPVHRATPPAVLEADPQQGAFYSLAMASGVGFSADAPCATPSREGGECYPATISAFVDTWVSAPAIAAPIPRDFTFKAVIGEPSW